MIPRMNIEAHFSHGTLSDIKAALAIVRDKPVQVRLIRVPVADFHPAVDATLQKIGPMPFVPCVFGHACEPSPIERPAVLCVADDNTNLHQNALTESEAL